MKDGPITTSELRAETLFPGELRDWFAGQALTRLLTTKVLINETAESFAIRAYGIADAMIARREKEEEQ